MGTTLRQRRPGYLFGHRFIAAPLLVLALAGLVASPAAALPPGVGIISSPGVAVDPCLYGPQIVTFAPTSSSIALGANTALNWSVKLPSGCGYAYSMTVLTGPQDWDSWTSSTGVTAQPQGTLAVQPSFNTVYMLIVAWGPKSSTSATAQVAVTLPLEHPLCPDVTNVSTLSLTTVPIGGPPSSVAPPCRRKVTIDANNLAPLLVQALGTPNTAVIVKNGVELDLSHHLGGAIHIADGVQLIGERVAEAGKPFQPGPRLYVTPDPYSSSVSNWPSPLFQIDGDNVRISGVRLEGPGATPAWWTRIDPAPGYTAAISLYDKMNIEIDHNELHGWNTFAVGVFGPADINFGENRAGRVWESWTKRATSDSSGIHYPVEREPVWIHDNYFHDNFWSTPYEGYGVDVGLGGHALIERNVFDVHFHAIATDGNFGSGYRAYRNLVFRNHEQMFDMHGRRCPPAPAWTCPPGTPAAHDIDIRWNSFSLPQVPAVKLMGTPELTPYGAAVQSNVFAHSFIGPDQSSCHRGNPYTADAVVMCGDGLLIGADNLLGVLSWGDPVHHSGSCDFDGDGINDDFMTTGQTWWYRSGDQRNGPTPWVFLNTNTLLFRDVTLGYFSAASMRNHVCDVLDNGWISVGGAGPWVPLTPLTGPSGIRGTLPVSPAAGVK